jgi:lipopolysaccharide export system protein LptC
MSEQGERDQRQKRGWAAPGGSHDRVIRILKLALPALIGVVLAFLAFSPLEDKQEVSFLLDKNKVDTAEERLKVTAAQYRGQDNEGRPFLLTARSALQPTSSTQIVDISDMSAQIQLDGGPARLQANRARYNMESDQVNVVGPLLVSGSDGYRMQTHDVNIDMRARTLQSRGAVQGQMPLGRFSADQLQANMGNRTVVLNGRARLHIVQGGIR